MIMLHICTWSRDKEFGNNKESHSVIFFFLEH